MDGQLVGCNHSIEISGAAGKLEPTKKGWRDLK
jgi:hypothetical protein